MKTFFVKRAIACFFSVMLFFGTVLAQDKVSIGVKGGFNIANVYDSKTENFSANPALGFVAGGFLTIPLSGALSIQPEVVYSQKGYTNKYTNNQSTFREKWTFNYLDIPLLVVLRMSDAVNIVVGPQVNFLLNTEYKMKQGDKSVNNKATYTSDWRKNTFAGHLGFDFNFGQLSVSPRVSVDVQDNNGKGVSTNPRFKNMFVQLTLGYKLM